MIYLPKVFFAMFSSQEYLDKKTGPHGIGRLPYLESLVNEFKETEREGAKLEVMANLANFAYDPINYENFRNLNIIKLFLDCLSGEYALQTSNSQLIEFAVFGICNLCLDKKNKDFILSHNGIQLVINCLSSSQEETVIAAITTLMYLVTPASKAEITAVPVIDAMIQFSLSSNSRIKNLADIFLQDYCTSDQIQQVRKLQSEWNQQVQDQASSSQRKSASNHAASTESR